MNQIFSWTAGILSGVYGVLTAFAGFNQIKANRIQVWAAWSFLLCGLLLILAGVMTLLRVNSALWVLVLGLLGIHVLAINNGF